MSAMCRTRRRRLRRGNGLPAYWKRPSRRPLPSRSPAATITSAHLIRGCTGRSSSNKSWFEKAGSAHPGLLDVHSGAASAYALKGETELAAAELAEAKKRTGDG